MHRDIIQYLNEMSNIATTDQRCAKFEIDTSIDFTWRQIWMNATRNGSNFKKMSSMFSILYGFILFMKPWHFLWNSFYILGFLAISFRVTALVKGPLYHCNNVHEITLLRFVMNQRITTQIAKFMGRTWGPPGSCRRQMRPMLAPWTLISGKWQRNGMKQGN